MLVRKVICSAIAAAALSSCYIPLDRSGTATLAWTIGGQHDPASCRARGTPFVRVVVRAEDDTVIADEIEACTSFETVYVLHYGWYTAALRLEDESRSAISETRDTGFFYVAPHVDTFESVDFMPALPPR